MTLQERPSRNRRPHSEAGIALITTLMVLMLLSGLMAGFFAAVNADIRATAIDRDQTQAYAVAHAGLEKLTSDLATLFTADVSPSVAQINLLATFPPAIPRFEFRAPGGALGSGYAVAFSRTDANGNPAPEDPAGSNITTEPYKGLKGIVTKYPITITARSITGNAEVRLRRELQTVAVPVFQFGIFSDTDLTFYAGDNFAFGGRVHTNGSLFLSEFYGFTMKFTDRITAVKDVVRTRFSNGLDIATYYFTGTVEIPTAIGSPGRNLKYTGPNEGSVAGMPGSAPNANWTSISVGTYKSIIRNGATGAKRLDLPLVSQGAQPIDLIRRPAVNEHTANPAVFAQRFYSQASLRILLSDRASDITGLPMATAGAPIALDGWLGGVPAGYGPVDATHPPSARSPGALGATATVDGNITGTSPTVTIAVLPVVPAALKIPLLSFGALTNVVCTGKTASTFTACVLTGAVSAGATVTATSGSMTQGTYTWIPQTTVVGSYASGTRDITVQTNGTLGFSRRTFWLNDTTAAAPAVPSTVVVSCTGYRDTATVHEMNGCSWSGNVAPGSGDLMTTNALVPIDTALLGGFIKVEKQDAAGVWTDVTLEILNRGFAAPNLEGAICADPTPDALLRMQRLRDNGGGACDYASSLSPYNYWPQALYDTREGNTRDVSTAGAMTVGGVMNYVALDVNNLRRWLAGSIGTTGATTLNNNGYIVYFSDRRGDHDETNGDVETGEYGFEDVINPLSNTGTPNGVLDGGENVNGPTNTVIDIYGQSPSSCCGVVPAGTTTPSPLDSNARPWTPFTAASSGNPAQARVNRQVLFRRALKLINGGISGGTNNLPAAGLTVASENPVYVRGDYNATATNTSAEPNVPAAVLADAVTLLSNNWNDTNSFRFPNLLTGASLRVASTTGFRFAVIAGKGNSFVWPSAGGPHFLFGTDGGVGNFLRLLENWETGSVAVNYRGSMVSLFVSRQATGTFKYGPNVYDYGDRNFSFDTDFLMPALMPPGTPMFRDVNTLTFRQILRPSQ